MSTIRRRGDTWQAIVRVTKLGTLVHSEARTFDSERLAKDWASRLERQIKATGVSARKKVQSTLAALITDYRKMRDEAHPLGRTINSDLDMLSATLGAHRLSDLSVTLWTDFARKRRTEGAGPATVLHNLATARIVLNAARPMFGLDVSGQTVSDAIKALTVSGHVAKGNERTRRPTPDEMQALDKEFVRVAAHPTRLIDMRLVLAVAPTLPRRLGELCSMRWDDYKGGVITLRDTKHPRRPRTEHVPVPPAARAILDTAKRLDERILPYASASVSASFDRACDRLGIHDLHFHDLRHEGICRLFESGLAIPEVAMISGHLSWVTLKRYTHLTPQHVLEKMDARPQAVSKTDPESERPGARH